MRYIVSGSGVRNVATTILCLCQDTALNVVLSYIGVKKFVVNMKNKNAMALGKKGGHARAQKRTKEELHEWAMRGVKARWGDGKITNTVEESRELES